MTESLKIYHKIVLRIHVLNCTHAHFYAQRDVKTDLSSTWYLKFHIVAIMFLITWSS